MPLIPYVPFTSGAVFTPESANAIASPVFDDQTQYLGHLPKILDSDLSDAPGAIKTRVGLLSANLRVSAGAGLNANFEAGKLLYGTTLYPIGASSIALPPSAISFIYGTTSGTIAASIVQPPVIRALLATVVTNTTGVITVTDYREGVSVEVVRPFTLSIRNFGGRGDQGAFNAAGGEVLTEGEYYFTDFTVGAGKTITVSKLARIYCTGAVNIAGIVNVTPASTGGAVIVGAGYQVGGGAGKGAGGGYGEIPADTYNHIVSPVGSGGSGGYAAGQTGTVALRTTAGGDGGGCVWFEAAGSINVTGGIFAQGTAGGPGGITTNVPGNYACNAGAGGGSGGLILLKSLSSIVISGQLNVIGGVGGNGFNAGSGTVLGEDGSGGGGGRIFLACPSINTTGSTLILSGGSAGTGFVAGGGVGAIGGTGGSFGGIGGTQIANGVAGAAGIITTRFAAAIG